MTTTKRTFLLGSAQWGWTVARDEAFRLLDAWLAAGHRHVDAATNYPINKIPADFRASEKILQEYIQAHQLHDLQITMKIGSLDNMRTPDINLAPSFILMMTEEYCRLFGDNLRSVMLHWDNRTEPAAIGESLAALAQVENEFGLRPGLSGIKHPDIYLPMMQTSGHSFDIQLKHNVLQSDLSRYTPFFQIPGNRFFAYGINAGGIKLEGPYPAVSTFRARGGDPEKEIEQLRLIRERLSRWNTAFVRPPLRTMNQIGLINAGLNTLLNGMILGFSSTAQLSETLDFYRNLEVFDYSDVFADLQKLTG